MNSDYFQQPEIMNPPSKRFYSCSDLSDAFDEYYLMSTDGKISSQYIYFRMIYLHGFGKIDASAFIQTFRSISIDHSYADPEYIQDILYIGRSRDMTTNADNRSSTKLHKDSSKSVSTMETRSTLTPYSDASSAVTATTSTTSYTSDSNRSRNDYDRNHIHAQSSNWIHKRKKRNLKSILSDMAKSLISYIIWEEDGTTTKGEMSPLQRLQEEARAAEKRQYYRQFGQQFYTGIGSGNGASVAAGGGGHVTSTTATTATSGSRSVVRGHNNNNKNNNIWMRKGKKRDKLVPPQPSHNIVDQHSHITSISTIAEITGSSNPSPSPTSLPASTVLTSKDISWKLKQQKPLQSRAPVAPQENISNTTAAATAATATAATGATAATAAAAAIQREPSPPSSPHQMSSIARPVYMTSKSYNANNTTTSVSGSGSNIAVISLATVPTTPSPSDRLSIFHDILRK